MTLYIHWLLFFLSPGNVNTILTKVLSLYMCIMHVHSETGLSIGIAFNLLWLFE